MAIARSTPARSAAGFFFGAATGPAADAPRPRSAEAPDTVPLAREADTGAGAGAGGVDSTAGVGVAATVGGAAAGMPSTAAAWGGVAAFARARRGLAGTGFGSLVRASTTTGAGAESAVAGEPAGINSATGGVADGATGPAMAALSGAASLPRPRSATVSEPTATRSPAAARPIESGEAPCRTRWAMEGRGLAGVRPRGIGLLGVRGMPASRSLTPVRAS
jgi:hypothetical protein